MRVSEVNSLTSRAKFHLLMVVFEHIQIPCNVFVLHQPLMKHKWNFDVSISKIIFMFGLKIFKFSIWKTNNPEARKPKSFYNPTLKRQLT